MSELPIRQLCAAAIVCGGAMSLIKQGPVKQIAGILTGAVLLLAVWSCISGTELQSYSLYTAKLDEGARLRENADGIEKELTGEVIRRRCETYIMDKADALNTGLDSARVELQWSMDGVWIPYYAELVGEHSKALEQSITAELGIPRERQKWKSSDG